MPDPSSIANLIGWYKSGTGLFKDAGATQPVSADGDSIALWQDQSGNGNHITQATAGNQLKWDPGLSVVQCPYNSPGFMQLPAGLNYSSQSITMAFIGTLVTLRDSQNGGANQSNQVWLQGTADKCNFFFERKGILATYDSATVHTVGTSPLHTSPIFVCFTSSASGVTVYVGAGSTSLGALALSSINGGNLFGEAAGTFTLSSRILDQVFYSRALNSTEVGTLYTYAQTRGVQTKFNGNLIIDGDSISAGIGSTLNRNWAQKMLLPPGIRQANVAEQSIPLATLVTEAATTVDPYFLSGVPNVLVVFAGINDFAINSATEATVYNNLKSYCTARKTANPSLKIVVVTMLPSKVQGTFTQANWTAYNNDILNGFAGSTLACDGVADVTSDSRIGAWGANTNTTFYLVDQIHPNDTGYGIIAPIISAKVIPFLPFMPGFPLIGCGS